MKVVLWQNDRTVSLQSTAITFSWVALTVRSAHLSGMRMPEGRVLFWSADSFHPGYVRLGRGVNDQKSANPFSVLLKSRFPDCHTEHTHRVTTVTTVSPFSV